MASPNAATAARESHSHQFTGVGQTITFSGLATHAEFCF